MVPQIENAVTVAKTAIAQLEASDVPYTQYLCDADTALLPAQQQLVDDVVNALMDLHTDALGIGYSKPDLMMFWSMLRKKYDLDNFTIGESDSFGVLSICCHTKKGIVVFE